ncbi:MAG: RDD family protein [Halothermotrichaceae bacterium]
MKYQKADLANRFLALFIDLIIAWAITYILPLIGGIIGVLYMLFRDGLVYQLNNDESWKNKSIGKKLFNLEVIKLDGGYVDLAISARRNITLTVGNFIAIVPILGWIFGPLIGFVLIIVELIISLSDSKGQRLGDNWANTIVVNESFVVDGEVIE